jgi:SagB-type dehydrogenase family enzyme
MGGHSLDWSNQPGVYKDYSGIDPLSLPKDVALPEEKVSSLIRERGPRDGKAAPDIRDLSAILRLTYSLTARARHPDGDVYFRSAASAGALYPTEIYVAAHRVEGLEDGLYHFAIHHHGLYPLRKQDLGSHIAGVVEMPGNKDPVLTFFLTAIFFRSAWKYRDRSYRYHLLDTGHVIENLALALKAHGFPYDVSYDFEDKKVNHLLGLEETREVTLAVARVPGRHPIRDAEEKEVPALPREIGDASRVSPYEIDYPAVGEVHRAGTLAGPGGKAAPEMIRDLGFAPSSRQRLAPPTLWPEVTDYREALFRRRSRRNFVKESFRKDGTGALLESLCRCGSEPFDRERGYGASLAIGFLAGEGEPLAPGFYMLDPSSESVGQVAAGALTQRMARICLDQAWLKNAALHFLFLSNLDTLDRTRGARGYRYAMLTAGRMGERLYIAATAMGMGCCGIGAFYDGEAAGLLGLNEASRLLYLVAVGPIKRA